METFPDCADFVVIMMAPLAATAPYKAAADAPFNKVIWAISSGLMVDMASPPSRSPP